MTNIIKRIESIDYHRNGVCGAPFHLVRFTADGGRPFIATVFQDQGAVAVVALDNLDDKWRGDAFEDELRAACYLEQVRDAVKAGYITAESVDEYTELGLHNIRPALARL